jgi:hypothetical protein
VGRESRYDVYAQLLLVVLEIVPQDYEVNRECLTLLMRRLRGAGGIGEGRFVAIVPRRSASHRASNTANLG